MVHNVFRIHWLEPGNGESKVWSSVNCPTVKMVSVFRYCSSSCWFATSYYHINSASHSRHCFRPRPPTWFWSKTQILSFGVLHRERSMFLIAYQIHGPNSIKRDILFTFPRTFYRNLWALFFQISTTSHHSPPSLIATSAMFNRALIHFLFILVYPITLSIMAEDSCVRHYLWPLLLKVSNIYCESHIHYRSNNMINLIDQGSILKKPIHLPRNFNGMFR